MKILAIGNSFSQDATARLRALAQEAGQNLTVQNLYIGGCSLEQHCCNAALDRPLYELEEDGRPMGSVLSIKQALSLEQWDWVTLQQASHFSGFYERYRPWAKILAAYVRHLAPGIKIAVHETWAYENGSQRLGDMHFASSEEMFRSIEACYHQMVREIQADLLIPCGKAMELARRQPEFDEARPDTLRICRDTFHASLTHGRYLLSAVWFQAFTGRPASESGYCPEGVTREELGVLQHVAQRAF